MSAEGGWIERDDNVQSCPSLMGSVSSSETVARLLHSTIEEPKGNPFKRDEIFPQKAGFTNECGVSDGCSLVRRDGLTDEDVRDRAKQLAALRIGREGRGALLASAMQLRSLEHPGRPGERAIKIYDDPKTDDQHHCVLRAADMPRPQQNVILAQLRSSFSGRITP